MRQHETAPDGSDARHGACSRFQVSQRAPMRSSLAASMAERLVPRRDDDVFVRRSRFAEPRIGHIDMGPALHAKAAIRRG